jgi:hypothetical protein
LCRYAFFTAAGTGTTATFRLTKKRAAAAREVKRPLVVAKRFAAVASQPADVIEALHKYIKLAD